MGPGLTALPSRADYLARWSVLHGGYDPASSPFVGRWLSLVYVLARPLAALRVPPDLITLLGVLASGGAAASSHPLGAWLCAAALLVAMAGLLDGLDGAVAVLSGRTTTYGRALDSAADRCAELFFLVALHLAGADLAWCAAAGVLTLLLELVRARAVAGGMTEIGVVTVWEKPTRVLVTAMFLLGAAVFGSAAAPSWARAAVWVWVGLGAVGIVQLTVVVRRRAR